MSFLNITDRIPRIVTDFESKFSLFLKNQKISFKRWNKPEYEYLPIFLERKYLLFIRPSAVNIRVKLNLHFLLGSSDLHSLYASMNYKKQEKQFICMHKL